MKRIIGIALLLSLALGAIVAEGLTFDFNGVALNSGVTVIPLPTGADVQFGLPAGSLGGMPLTAVARLRGGWEDGRILRDPVSGDIAAAPGDFKSSGGYRYYMPNFQWALGATLGLVQREKGNLVEAFAFYRGRLDFYQTSLVGAAFPDLNGLFGTSVLAGVAYDSTFKDSRRVRHGLFSEASFEYGPGFVNSGFGGTTDFWRLDLKASGYLPLLTLGQASNDGLNLFSAYLAGFASVDYADGGQVPIWVMQSFGGRDLRGSLGDCVRGYPSSSYDSKLKAVANLEVRAIGPALFGQAWLVPMLYAFVDGGFYSGFAGATADAAKSGNLMSAGVGLNVDIFDFAYAGVYAVFPFGMTSDLYGRYTVNEKGSVFPNIQFLLHF